jgi:protoporphyrinogen/coproporphyrinogen III oxidase
MVPTKIVPTVFSSLFSMRTKMRIAAEWFHPPRPATEDETVAAMVERHYGLEMVDLLADPLLSGVYGGEAANLSVRAVLPRFVEMEAKHGSLGRAMLATRTAVGNKTAAKKAPARPIFSTLKDGMQQMIDALVAHVDPKAMKTSSSVKAVAQNGNGWTVHTGQSAQFDAVIIATPTHAAAAMLQSADPSLARELSDIKYSSSVTVTLCYDERVRRSLPPGFGFLVPRREGRRVLAATFVHNKLPHRAPDNRALVRCFLGGSRDEQILQSCETEILQIVRGELRQILGDTLAAEPLFARVYKWRSAMAQYSVGHIERVQQIESHRQKLPGLALAGNGYSGIGVPDCVRSGVEAAGKVLTEIEMGQSV